ncbi:MAG: MATE family efflux transporter [Erysipelotrichia bacterium]|nr:MATE family efflux transporter [Erysipelotrichia bacterium]
MNHKTFDLTQGNITKQLLAFAFPIFLASVFQQLYNTVDTMIVGNFLGDQALAAIGASGAIYELIVGFTIGVGSGFSIVVAKYFGAKDETHLKQSVATSIILSAILTIIVMLLSVFILYPFLTMLNTPAEIIQQAHEYIFIICMGVGVSVAYNLTAGLLRAIGNSITPLIVLLITSFLNIGLDLLFVVTLQMGVAGAGIATLISQAVSAIICILYIIKKCPILTITKSAFIMNKKLYQDMIFQGSSMGLMLSIVSLGTLILQGAINAFGTLTIAAHTTARKLTAFMSMPLSTLASASATFTSQNKGANHMVRVKEGVKKAIILSSFWCFIITIINFMFAADFVSFISGSTKVELVNTATLYLAINIPFFFVLGPLLILRSALQGLGKKVIPLVFSIIELLGKIVFVILLIPLLDYLGVCICEPIIWILMTLQLIYAFYNNPEIKNIEKPSLH